MGLTFSQRNGKTAIRDVLQIEAMDSNLENRIWNTFLTYFFLKISKTRETRSHKSPREQVCEILWSDFLGRRIDEIPGGWDQVYTDSVLESVKIPFFEKEWYYKYDFIEFICKLDRVLFHFDWSNTCNFALKQEMAGYRILEDKVVQITSEEEIVEMEEALITSKKWNPVYTHLQEAIEKFSNRKNPDYRNSIKESISAIEALCIIITGNKKATLGDALSQIEKKYKLHGALKKAFSSLYGYTSASGGIRHSLTDDDIEVTFEDAKFILVSCSAFINYLKSIIG